jgi:hypothetical protein
MRTTLCPPSMLHRCAFRNALVPLSKGALRILHAVPHFVGQDFIFPGDQGGRMTDVALSKELHKLMTGVTVHGFRSLQCFFP